MENVEAEDGFSYVHHCLQADLADIEANMITSDDLGHFHSTLQANIHDLENRVWKLEDQFKELVELVEDDVDFKASRDVAEDILQTIKGLERPTERHKRLMVEFTTQMQIWDSAIRRLGEETTEELDGAGTGVGGGPALKRKHEHDTRATKKGNNKRLKQK
jgi:hypothetical protein